MGVSGFLAVGVGAAIAGLLVALGLGVFYAEWVTGTET